MLQDHYRSHPAIIDFPNKMFYEGKLKYCADPAVTESLLRYDRLVRSNFPVIFHALTGKDEREGRSPSWFNASEAIVVKTYAESLINDNHFRLSEFNRNHHGARLLKVITRNSSQ